MAPNPFLGVKTQNQRPKLELSSPSTFPLGTTPEAGTFYHLIPCRWLDSESKVPSSCAHDEHPGIHVHKCWYSSDSYPQCAPLLTFQFLRVILSSAGLTYPSRVMPSNKDLSLQFLLELQTASWKAIHFSLSSTIRSLFLSLAYDLHHDLTTSVVLFLAPFLPECLL